MTNWRKLDRFKQHVITGRWTRNFVISSLVNHYLSNDTIDGSIESTILATIGRTCKTSDQIKRDYKSTVDKCKIMSKIKDIVTDSVNTNKSVFQNRENIEWYPYSAHNLQTALRPFQLPAPHFRLKWEDNFLSTIIKHGGFKIKGKRKK